MMMIIDVKRDEGGTISQQGTLAGRDGDGAK
jgi:hypothetical protein